MNTQQNEKKVSDIKPKYLGTVLKQAREAKGLTEKDVADRLRLRVSVIRELEANCSGEKQIAIFTRGYIRSYAKLIGLDANTLLSGYQPIKDNDDVTHKMQSFSRKIRLEKHDSCVMGLTWIILAVVVGLTAFWWWQNQQGQTLLSLLGRSSLFTLQETEANLVIDEALSSLDGYEDGSEKIQILLENDSSSLIKLSDSNEKLRQPAAVPIKMATGLSPVTVIPKQKTEPIITLTTLDRERMVSVSSLTLNFTADCWVDIRDSSGKRLVTGIKSAGDTLVLSGNAPFKMVLGAPEAVDVSYFGKTIDLSGYPSGRVARLSLPK
ncbi:cytoskeleton protein RodZ [Candidatus Enterovibrio escicola]|uniref:Putative membrane protein n=1 Tax=Candidatus Enterovibrio escicola TaxID=1927127 RepID=A0A2A5T5K9_9GAMM|nr:cytoskeleton protein RodZ [Candidatus Enterovibrio escacola]PCS23426.1 putative membrane protein [Candidatus Enterovibrio escacola]